MGGKVFATASGGRPALASPRISPSLYRTVQGIVSQKLQKYYDLAASPKEAPGKIDHGDIDFIVAGPKAPAFRAAWSDMAPEKQRRMCAANNGDVNLSVIMDELSAVYQCKNGGTRHLAYPHPDLDDAVIQIDVYETSMDMHAWRTFNHSYGDFWNIIGAGIRPCGLTVSDTGFYVRDPEMEEDDQKRARMLLTREPAQVLEFLGIDALKWSEGWISEREMFDFVTTIRVLSPTPYLVKSNLKSNDRRRMRQRPTFARFIDKFALEWDKKYSAGDGSGTGVSSEWRQASNESDNRQDRTEQAIDNLRKTELSTRETVLHKALTTFGLEDAFYLKRDQWKNEKLALEEKRKAKAQARLDHAVINKSYAQHWIDWLLLNMNDEERRCLNLDMDRDEAQLGAKISPIHSIAQTVKVESKQSTPEDQE